MQSRPNAAPTESRHCADVSRQSEEKLERAVRIRSAAAESDTLLRR